MLGAPVPLYHQVFQVLRTRITSGEYAPGMLLPPEERFTRDFRVSRHTVRMAMQYLAQEGLIERFAGRGTFVVQRGHRRTQWTIGSIEDLIGASFSHNYRIVSARFVPARAHAKVAALFEAPPDDTIFHVRAVRSSEAGPYAYSSAFLPRWIGEKLPAASLAEGPLLLLADEHAGVVPARAQQVSSSVAANRDAARLLDVEIGAPLLVMERTYFTEDGHAMTYSRVQARSDRYQQVIDFARREAAKPRPRSARRLVTDAPEAAAPKRRRKRAG
jgi:GntR family transcriptional regulator